jgi:hypothetical protein
MAFKIRKAGHKYVERGHPVRVAHTNYKTAAIGTTRDKRIHFTITMEWERREKRSNTNKKQKGDKRIESIFRVACINTTISQQQKPLSQKTFHKLYTHWKSHTIDKCNRYTRRIEFISTPKVLVSFNIKRSFQLRV